MEGESELKRPLLGQFQRYESMEPVWQRHSTRHKKAELKWERRFRYLLIVLLLFSLLSCILALLAYERFKHFKADSKRMGEKECQKALDNPTGQYAAFQALPSHLRTQLRMSIPSANNLPQGANRNGTAKQPNFLIFLADDLGFSDLAIDGHPTQPWGPLDEMASKGMRFRNFYADAFCTPSRAQLLTGRLAVRSGMQGENPRVLLTISPGGLPDSEVTIPELLRDNGYATGMTGKWHLGINCERGDDGCHLPFNHGFDEVGTYFPISNNLVCDETKRYSAYPNPTICFLYKGRGTTPSQAPVYHENLTETIVGEAKDFITKNRDKPWMYYFASPHTHDVMYASQKYRGSTTRGDFGDALNEMNWAAGDIVRHLNSLSLLEDTVVIFFADNGAPTTDCGQAGNNGLLRSGKGTGWEGGNRATAFVYGPGRVSEGLISDAVVTGADFFPTMAAMAGIKPDPNILLDGKDLSAILSGDGKASQEEKDRPWFFYCGRTIFAVRYKSYKLHFITNIDPEPDCYDGEPPFTINPVNRVLARQNCNDSSLITRHDPPLLFNLNADPSEMYPLNTTTRSDLMAEFQQVIDQHRESMVFVEDQMSGPFNPFLIPCASLKDGCVINYPDKDKFEFPTRVICIVFPQFCITDPNQNGGANITMTEKEKEMMREYFPEYASKIENL